MQKNNKRYKKNADKSIDSNEISTIRPIHAQGQYDLFAIGNNEIYCTNRQPSVVVIKSKFFIDKLMINKLNTDYESVGFRKMLQIQKELEQ